MKIKKASKIVVIGTVAGLIIVSIFIYISYLFQQEFEKTTVSATQQQLLMIAKSTSTTLEEFILAKSKALKTLSNNPSVQEEVRKGIKHKYQDVTYCPVKYLYEIHKKEVDALTTLDANGIMLHRHPFVRGMPGLDATGKPGVAYVLREHKPYVSEVFYNKLGNLAISISEPVFYKDNFVGIVRWMIQLDTISKRFIQPVGVGKKGCVKLLDNSGTMLSHPKTEHVGKHIMAPRKECFPNQDWSDLEDIVEKMTNGEEGVGIYHSAWWTEKELKMAKKITAYAPVNAGNTLWSVLVVMDYSEIADPVNKNAIKTFGLAGLIILLFGIGGIVLFRIRKKKVELETEAKYLKEIASSAEALRKAHDELKNYTENLEKIVEERTKIIAEEKEKIDGILQSVMDGLLVTDIDHKVLLINPAFESLLDIKAKELIGHKIGEKVKDTRLKNIIEKTLSKKQSEDSIDFKIENPLSKKTKFLQARAAVVHDKFGKPFGIVTVIRDITHQSEVDRLKSEFMTTVAHELRTPLTSIQGFSELLTTREDLNEQKKQQYLNFINNETVHLAKIISDFLDISRIESGRKLKFDKEYFILSELIDEIIASFETISPKHKFVLNCPPEAEDYRIYANKEKLSQVFVNILNNAIKYSPERSKITITGEKLKDKIQISIKDEGSGIAEKDIPHIFDKFYRADNLTTRKVDGVGLSLSIAKYIIEQHKGNITVKSKLNKGSNFIITLPVV